MNLSKLSVKRPVTTLMCVFIAVAFGLMSMFNLSMDMMPNMNIPIVLVITSYDGAGSEEMKTLITEPIEESVATISGLDTLTSTSSMGSSMVMIRFDYSVNIDVAAQDVREKVDMIKSTLPDAANDPMIMKIDINSMTGNIYIMATAENKNINELKKLLDDKVVPRLERQNGVASVSLMGGNDKIVEITLNHEKLRAYGITESTISGLLMSENINTPLGSVYEGDKNLTLRIKGEFRDIKDIEDVIIPTGKGGNIFLSDIATVKEKYDTSKAFTYANGTESIMLSISKNSTANTVDVSKAVFSEMTNIQEELPDVNFITISNPADYIQNSLSSVGQSAIEGALFAIIVLFLFLRELRSTLIVAVSMPVSIITTFAVMRLANVNFNLMSLGGLALGIGMLVDNSIVVMESIFVKLEQGKDRITAAIEGGSEVINSVLASTLTTVAVFFPITLAGGQVAELFNDMCLTIVFSLLSSLVVSVTFVPMACSILLSPEDVKVTESKGIIGKLLDGVSAIITAIEKIYKKVLVKALNFKKATVAIALLFVVLTGAVIPTMHMEFMPNTDEGEITIDVDLPKGSRIAATEKIAWQVVNAIDDEPEIKDIAMNAGGTGSMAALMGSSEDSATIRITLRKKSEGRKVTTDEVASNMRKKIANIAGAEIEVNSSGSSMGSYSSSGFQVNIFGDDSEQLENVSEELVEIVKTFRGVSDVKSSIEDSAPNATIRIDKRKANSMGISVSSLSSILRTNISGSKATTYRINGDEYDIKIVSEDGKIDYISDVEQILVPTSSGTAIPLSEVSEIIDEDIPVSISRENQTDMVSITANLDGAAISEIEDQFNEAMRTYNMPSEITWKFGGISERMQKAFSGLYLALIVAVFLVYMIMAAEFEAFSFPFIVMFSIPIAITGGLFGTFISRSAISVTSLLGLIMLAGVVVNNAIVLIDYGNLQIRENGLSYKEAMLVAGPMRLRPILMSTLTTVLGMIPMMISQADGAETMRGLAVTVVFGLSLSTLVTLLLIPAIYVAFNERIERNKKRRQAKKEKRLAKKAAAAE